MRWNFSATGRHVAALAALLPAGETVPQAVVERSGGNPLFAEEMARRNRRTELVEIPGCGHAPALLDADQVAIVTAWMARTAAA